MRTNNMNPGENKVEEVVIPTEEVIVNEGVVVETPVEEVTASEPTDSGLVNENTCTSCEG